jgi:hypothetical protein
MTYRRWAAEIGVDGSTGTTTTSTTATTIPNGSTTSTTIAVPQCTGDAACDDGDSCTDDTCTGGRCRQVRRTSFALARCEALKLREPALCGSDRPDPKLAKAIDRTVTGVQALLDRAESATGKRRGKLTAQTGRKLQALERKAAHSRRTAPACRSAVSTHAAQARQLVLALRP